jgi:hypothetical protein
MYTPTTSPGANAVQLNFSAVPGAPDVGLSMIAGVTVKVALAVSPDVAPRADTRIGPPASVGTVSAALKAPLASAVACPANTLLMDRVTTSPGANAVLLTVRAVPGAPDL